MSVELDIEYFSHLLTEKAEALYAVSETSQAATQTVELDQSKVGRVSRVDALQAQEMSKATEARRIAELNQIKAAQQRIKNGEYGFCLECDELITNKRLAIDPAATLCIQCATRAESNLP